MRKKLICILVTAVLLSAWCFQTFAAGDVSTAIENTWKAAQTQIKNVAESIVPIAQPIGHDHHMPTGPSGL